MNEIDREREREYGGMFTHRRTGQRAHDTLTKRRERLKERLAGRLK